MQSHTYIEFYDIFKKWYLNGKKIVPNNFKITPTIAKFWYIGDGSRNFEKAKYATKNARTTLCTNCFNNNSIKILLKELKNIGISCYACKASDPNPNNQIIQLTPKYSDKFLEYIGPCPPEIYNVYGYKWRKAEEGRTKKEWLERNAKSTH